MSVSSDVSRSTTTDDAVVSAAAAAAAGSVTSSNDNNDDVTASITDVIALARADSLSAKQRQCDE